ncbi:hypothetical protein KUTeg_000247 [Tegillarca granosa]|uniref:protein-tyrosine-phosphatase n=1 Tax=Tegillarca granosa TaxID=220873 RepID=A0ABQ9G036_TEGGR|nr:hypothetical protein KUTeg_000247 [Tegillarca granosa]
MEINVYGLYFTILIVFSCLNCGTEASQNIAVGKSANQSSTHGHFTAERAVDGDVNQDYNYCSLTSWNQKASEAWWQVNLESLSDINSVKIYYRQIEPNHESTRRLDGFEVIVSSSSDNWRNKTRCYNDTVGRPYPEDVVTVPCVGRGRYLTIFNKHNAPVDNQYGSILELCEVQVYGCKRGMYGTNCTQTCPSGCFRYSCDPDNGNCKLACDYGKFGYSCASTCNCKDGGCNNVNGTCFRQECLAGWTGHNCSVECEQDTFGPNCIYQCHCLSGTCYRTNGTCTVAGCEAGWAGETCSEVCMKNQFGKDCKSICHCKSEGCDRFSGICKHTVCDDGWKGKQCDEACENGTFGNQCNSTCYCAVGSCNHISGKCVTPGCQEGWQGISCSERLVESKPNEPNVHNIIPTVVGIVIAVLLVAILCGIIVFVIRRVENLKTIISEYKPLEFETQYKSVNKKAHYVATQGPRQNTIDDFWRMIWQIKCGKIVMLTNLIENGKTGEIRNINHFHFTAWPDHGTPDPIQLMLFHRRYMEIESDQSGPPVIHCSAGIGRTGTFIALDALYKEGQKTREIDVYRYVHIMRENRMNMIQTKEQYVVLHEALLEAFQFKDTSHTKEEFCNGIYENDKDIKEEFERLNRSKPVFDQKEAYKGAKEKMNQCKNRNNNIVPVDRYRPYLMSHSPARTNYINAVILPDIEWLPKDSKELVCDSYTIQQTREPDICGETKETELVLRYGATERSIKLFQYQGWEITNDVPSSPNGILKLIEMVNSWKIAGDKGPITVICTYSMRYEEKIDIFHSVRLLQLRRPEFFLSLEQYRFCYKAVQEYLESANIYYN